MCNGDNSTCKDCHGVPNGGDGASCADCAGVLNGGSDGQKVLGGIRYFTQAIKDFAESLAKCDPQKPYLGRARFQQSRSICERASAGHVKQALRRYANKLFALLWRVQEANRLCYGLPAWDGKGTPSAWSEYQDLLENIAGLPDNSVQCRN